MSCLIIQKYQISLFAVYRTSRVDLIKDAQKCPYFGHAALTSSFVAKENSLNINEYLRIYEMT